MENKEMLELEELMTKLDEAGEDESAIEKAFMSSVDPEELKEEDLDDVTGGVLAEWEILKAFVKYTKVGKLSWEGAKICARCFYDYYKYGDAYRTYSEKYVNKKCKDLENALPRWMLEWMD